MEVDSSAHQSEMGPQSPVVEVDVQNAAASLLPAVQKMAAFQPVSCSSTSDGRESQFLVDDDQTSSFSPDVNQDSRLQIKGEEGTHVSPRSAQVEKFESADFHSPHFSTPDKQGSLFSAQDPGDCPSVAGDNPKSDIPVGEVGIQFSAGTNQVPHFPVEHQSSEIGPDSERIRHLPLNDDQLCTLPSEHRQAPRCEPENGRGSHHAWNSDQVSHSRLRDDPSVQHQDQQVSQFSNSHESDFYTAEDHQKADVAPQEAFSISQFPSADAVDSQLASECDGDPEGEDGTCPFSAEQDQGSLDQVEIEDGVHPSPDGSRKRKLAVFAAAGAVIAIQTMLVAMPEIWQPLEDDDSAEKVAYQEGLHSWFGALNRAAWLLSTANGAGDGGWWVKPRTSVWFFTYLMSSDEDERWLAAIRMRRRTFLWICNSLEVHVRKQDTRLRPSIPVAVRVGATIYRLVNGVDYYEVADKFGVGESSVHEIMQDCVPAIVKVFGHHLRWPTGEAMTEVSRAFFEKCGLPNCQGALGSTHVEILNPSGPEARNYINRTGHFSIVLQAVADTSLSFLDVFCGYPERTYENKVLRNSGLYERALAGEILAGPIQRINGGFQLRPYVLGGSNYPLFPWLMVPYAPSSELVYSQEQFIHHHERGKIFTQAAFDILKRVFRVLGVGIRGRLELAPTIVHACCLLHNVLIRRKELDVEAELENMGAIPHPEDVEEGSSEPGDASSLEIRNQLAEYLVWAS